VSDPAGSALDLTERLRSIAPEYIDLVTAATDAQFENAFVAILEKKLAALERSKREYQEVGEVGLTAFLVAALSVPGLTASQEMHSAGHVDITVEADHCVPMRRKLGEAKIYKGPAYHEKGLEQLLGRYTTGREGHGLLIVYFRNPDIAGLVKKLRKTLDADLPLRQKGATSDHVLKWSFSSVHGHSCGEDLQVDHVGCNLHVESSK
jgi:hypothetical protein